MDKALGCAEFCRRLAIGSAVLWLAACDAGGGSGSGPPPPVNAAPTNVQLVEVSSLAVGQLTASWLPAQDDSTSSANLRYQLHASTQEGFAPAASTLRLEVTGLVSGTISSGLTPGARHYVKLVAMDAAGATTVGQALAVTVADTAATPVPGVAVRTLSAAQTTQVTSNAVTLAAGVAAPAVGAVIANGEGAGYLRIVTAVAPGAQTVLTTRPAALHEVLSDLSVSSSVRMAALPATGAAAAREQALGLRADAATPTGSNLFWPGSNFTYVAGEVESQSARKRALAAGTTVQPLTALPRFEVGPI